MLAKDIDKKLDKEIIYGQKLNQDGNAEGQFLKLDERTTDRRSRDGSFQIEYADDSSDFLVVKHPSYEKYADEKFNFKIFNADLKLLQNLEITLPFKDKNFSVSEIHLSRSNIIYILAKIDVPREDAKKDEARHYYQIVSVDAANGATVKQYDLKLDSRYIDEVTMRIDKNENVKCLGFYSDLKENGRPKEGLNGLFYFGLNKANKQVENVSIKEFTKALVEELSGKRRAKKEKGLESTFKLKYFLEKNDGSSIALVEEDYVEVVTTYTTNANGGSTRTTTYYYHNNEILAIYIDAAGKINQFVTIPKSQVSTNDGGIYNSFYATQFNDKTYLVYNDDRENATNKDFKNTMYSVFKSKPVVIILSNSGKYEKSVLGDVNGKTEFAIRPRLTDKISDASAIFYAYRLNKGCCCLIGKKNRTSRFGLLTIK